MLWYILICIWCYFNCRKLEKWGIKKNFTFYEKKILTHNWCRQPFQNPYFDDLCVYFLSIFPDNNHRAGLSIPKNILIMHNEPNGLKAGGIFRKKKGLPNWAALSFFCKCLLIYSIISEIILGSKFPVISNTINSSLSSRTIRTKSWIRFPPLA